MGGELHGEGQLPLKKKFHSKYRDLPYLVVLKLQSFSKEREIHHNQAFHLQWQVLMFPFNYNLGRGGLASSWTGMCWAYWVGNWGNRTPTHPQNTSSANKLGGFV